MFYKKFALKNQEFGMKNEKKKVSRFWPILDECIFPNVSPNTYNHCFYLLFATMRYFSFDCPVWQCRLWSLSKVRNVVNSASAASTIIASTFFLQQWGTFRLIAQYGNVGCGVSVRFALWWMQPVQPVQGV